MLVSGAQEEDGCDCCVPIKSKWQSDLGEAQRGYIFSQPLSQGCSFFPCLPFMYFFIWFLLWCWSHGCLFSIGKTVYRAELRRRSGLSAEVDRGIDCFTSLSFLTSPFSFFFSQAVSIKMPSFAHYCTGKRAWLNYWNLVSMVFAHQAAGWKKNSLLVWLLLDVSWSKRHIQYIYTLVQIK